MIAAAALALGLPATALALTLHAQPGTSAPPSRTTQGVSEIGALYPTGSPDIHDCTASVVDSPEGNTLMTAAHCVSGTGAGMTFVPGGSDAGQPDSRWTVTAVHVTSHWIADQDPHEDVAFLTVAPQEIAGRSTEIQQVTGAYQLGPVARPGEQVQVTGYPEGSASDAVTCAATIYETAGYPSFDCQGYADGTSGSPWVLRTRRGTEIVGLIGGLHQGGCEDSTSYSPILTPAVRAAYRLAAEVIDPDSAPSAGGDGC